MRPRRATRIAATLAAAAACALVVSVASPALADPDPDAVKKSQLDRRITTSQIDLDDISANLVSANSALQQTNADVAVAQGASAAAESKRVAAQARHQQAIAALKVAKANEAVARKKLKATTKKLTKQRTQVASVASQIYQQQGAGDLAVALQATSPTEFVDRLALVDTVLAGQQRAVSALSTTKAVRTANESHLAAVQKQKSAAETEAKNSLSAATAARNAAVAAQARLESLQSQQKTRTVQLAAAKKKEEGTLSQMQAESTRLGKILAKRAEEERRQRAAAAAAAAARAAKERREEAKRQAAAQRRSNSNSSSSSSSSSRSRSSTRSRSSGGGGSGSSGRTGGYLSFPMPGAPSTSEFGMRYHPILRYSRLHSGLDFGAACGTPVRAAAPGRIISAGWAGGYGNRVVIAHGYHSGASLATSYNHLQRIKKYSGSVSRGQIIGYEGTTGLSTGCHLHFEALSSGTPVNPRRFM